MSIDSQQALRYSLDSWHDTDNPFKGVVFEFDGDYLAGLTGQTFDDILETGQMPDKSPFESISDEEYKAMVMSQFKDELEGLMKHQKIPRKATKKK